MTPTARPVSYSRTYRSEIILANHMNGSNRLFGGQLAQWIDIVGGVTARRHSGTTATTAVIDRLEFIAPAFLDDMLLMVGQVTWTGSTSMEIRVDTFIEKPAGKELINRCYMVAVAIDKDGCPVKVPGLICRTLEEKEEFEAGRIRTERRRAERSGQRR